MSTRSNLSVQQPDGTFLGIYCHSNGYLEYNGQLLQRHYATAEAASALVALGDLSRLGRDGTPVAYHRDRGEPWEDVAPESAATMDDMRILFSQAARHFYCFRDGAWWVSCPQHPEWQLLADALRGVADATPPVLRGL